MVALSKNTGGSTSEDTVSGHLVSGSRPPKGEKRRNDAEDAGSAASAHRASTSEAPAPGNKKKKAKKSKKSSKNEKSSSQDTGGGGGTRGATKKEPVQPPPTSNGDTSEDAAQYLLNPQQLPSTRNHNNPVQTLTKMILGHHGLLLDTELEAEATQSLIKAMAATVTKEIHSVRFIQAFCIEQMGQANITIAAKVEEEIQSTLFCNLEAAAKIVDAYEGKKLVSAESFINMEKQQEAAAKLAADNLAATRSKLEKTKTASIDAIDKAMGEIFDLVEGHDFDGKAEVLASINSKRLLLHPAADIDYDSLRADNDVISVVEMQTATGAAMSVMRSQKYFDKYAGGINELEQGEAQAKLKILHGKIFDSAAKYTPDADEDFPAANSDFKKKFGVSRAEFWKMKALEKRLSCPITPGAIVDPEGMIAHFTSLSPSPSKRQRLSFGTVVDDGNSSDDTEMNIEKDEMTDKETDKMLEPKFDKSFEKPVDWTKPAAAKIIFSAADINSDITQFFYDFEEVMQTRAPYTTYEELLGRLKEPNITSAIREVARNAIAGLPATTIVEKRKLRIESYSAAKKFLLEQYEDDERGAKLLQSFEDTAMATGPKIFDSYVKYKMELDKKRRQISAVDNTMLSKSHFIRHYIARLAPKLKQRLEESEDYINIKLDESKLNAKLVVWSRAMQKASRPTSTLNTIIEADDEETDVNIQTESFQRLHSDLLSFLDERGKKKFAANKNRGIDKNKRGGGEKKFKDRSTYVDTKEIQEKAFKSCYTSEEWKKRKQAREQNEEYSKNPELYKKDMLKGKACCVKCRRVGHTANECYRGASHMQAIMKSLDDMKGAKAGQKKQLLAMLKKLQ